MTRTDSTAPIQANPEVPRPPSPGGVDPLAVVGEVVLYAWRSLRRMRTALYLLGALALLTLAATIVPQRPNVPTTADRWLDGVEGPGAWWSSLFDRVGFFDVYGSPLFIALLVLLFVSLTGCLVPRYRAWWRLVRRSQPPLSADLDRHDDVAEVTTSLPADEARAVAAGLLADRRWRLRPGDHTEQVAAERGLALREGGSLLFHTSFYVLLIGIVLGQLLGFSGQVGIVEGEQWAETAIGYWSHEPGRWWGENDHRGYLLTVDEFHVDWYRDPARGGTPRRFEVDVTVQDAEGTTLRDTIGGNDPLIVEGMKMHLLDWGYAPRVQVEVAGRLVHDGFVTMSPGALGFFQGAVKVPAADPDVGLQLTFVPTAFDAADPSTWTGAPWADAPLLTWLAYRGDLGLTAAQNVNVLDLDGLEQDGAGVARPGGEFTNGDVTVRFVELRRWVGLQVSNRPTLPLLLVGALLLLLGLLPALYAFRRRVWVSVRAGEVGSTLTVAGRTFQRPQAFEAEFDTLVDTLVERLPDAVVRRRPARHDPHPPHEVATT